MTPPTISKYKIPFSKLEKDGKDIVRISDWGYRVTYPNTGLFEFVVSKQALHWWVVFELASGKVIGGGARTRDEAVVNAHNILLRRGLAQS